MICMIAVVLRVLCYGSSPDSTDGYMQIAESAAMVNLNRFTSPVIERFGQAFLSSLTCSNIQPHTPVNVSRSLLGVSGFMNCTHWQWKKYAVGLQDLYRDRSGRCSNTLETVATQDLWV